ncbi:acetyltransferase [Aquimarina algiphila]|uniref:acetyltransferase n=1 Tax=Aquimarina algiphila TaxID=2047982 RepID=UPI0024920609|nr:acetyltransferase [Aquimarina algiphila]
MEEINTVRLYGAGGHAQIIHSVLKQNKVAVTEIFDDNPSGCHPKFKHISILEIDKDFSQEGDPFIIAIGDNFQRSEIAKFLQSEFATAIHSSAIIDPDIKIGKGTVVYAGAVIQPNTTIGKHVIINTLASVDHDNVIEDFVHISPNTTLCGLVHVGEGSHIGAGAVVVPKIKIGKWCIIGAGTVVIRDIPDYAVVVGNPGKIIKMNYPEESKK